MITNVHIRGASLHHCILLKASRVNYVAAITTNIKNRSIRAELIWQTLQEETNITSKYGFLDSDQCFTHYCILYTCV